MEKINWNKILTLVIVNVGVTVLAILGNVASEASIAIYGASLGYVFGNGHGLLEGERYIENQIKKNNTL